MESTREKSDPPSSPPPPPAPSAAAAPSTRSRKVWVAFEVFLLVALTTHLLSRSTTPPSTVTYPAPLPSSADASPAPHSQDLASMQQTDGGKSAAGGGEGTMGVGGGGELDDEASNSNGTAGKRSRQHPPFALLDGRVVNPDREMHPQYLVLTAPKDASHAQIIAHDTPKRILEQRQPASQKNNLASSSSSVAPFALAKSSPNHTRSYPTEIVNLTCPHFHAVRDSADRRRNREHQIKYERYTGDYCSTTGLLQMNIPASAHLSMLYTIAQLVNIQPNDVVLDWGCGCGTLLNFLHLNWNTTGFGLDLTQPAVQFARAHAQPNQLFCHMDGSRMSMFPSASFDAIVSWGAVYHIRRTLVQCEVVSHFVRLLKPGGVALVGHIRTDKSQEYWRKGKCRPPGATIVRYRDFKTFRQQSWKRHGFFSLIVYKGAAEGVPKGSPEMSND